LGITKMKEVWIQEGTRAVGIGIVREADVRVWHPSVLMDKVNKSRSSASEKADYQRDYK
jgi:hypothetical protein